MDDSSEAVIELGEADYKELAYTYLNYKNGGYKHCKGCGRLFKMHKNSPGRLYCKECGQKEEISELKAIKCVDCGEDIIISKFDTETCRCEDCYKEHRRQSVRENVRRFRDKNKM